MRRESCGKMDKFIVASGPVIIEDGKLLVSKDSKDDFYKIPGGRVKEPESFEETAIRRAKEEVNAEIEIIKPLYPNILYENPSTKEKMTIILINYLAKLKNKKEIRPIGDIKEVKWVEIEKIKKDEGNVSPNVKELVDKNF